MHNYTQYNHLSNYALNAHLKPSRHNSIPHSSISISRIIAFL